VLRGIAIYAGITTLSPSVAESIAGWFTKYLSRKVIFWQNIVVAADRDRPDYDRAVGRAIAA
jgi:hypothetical protein